MLEDLFPLWQDDKSLVVGAMKKTIKALPLDADFLEAFRPATETVTEFGEQLLDKVIQADAELLGLIEPSLQNWDADRVAVLDMIMLKMALSEFLYFSSIPTKVTLNEFVDISKLYSTDKSKEFVNGILDRLLRQLTDDKMINKSGRGLS
jgi:N utilization substance protein B